jgi:tetratricopeptide (TPR) repeat protein
MALWSRNVFHRSTKCATIRHAFPRLNDVNGRLHWRLQYLTARGNLVFIWQDLDRAKETVKHFRAASELAPNNLTYPMELAVLLEQTGQPEEAFEIFTRLSRADPKNYFFFRHLGFLCRDLRKDKAAALSNFRKSIDLNPDQPDVRTALSQL